MTKQTLAGCYNWETESHVFRFIDPFLAIVANLRAYRHCDEKFFREQYKLTPSEFRDLIGKAEEYCERNN